MNRNQLARLREELRPTAETLPHRGADIESFRQVLEEIRQRPVQLIPRALGPEILGLWLATDTADYIVYELNTSAYHQRHIVYHEGAHMLRGHEGPAIPDLFSTLAPHLDPKLVRSLLCHSVFNESEEAEAEVLATLIEEHFEQLPTTMIPEANPKATPDISAFFLRDR